VRRRRLHEVTQRGGHGSRVRQQEAAVPCMSAAVMNVALCHAYGYRSELLAAYSVHAGLPPICCCRPCSSPYQAFFFFFFSRPTTLPSAPDFAEVALYISTTRPAPLSRRYEGAPPI